VAYDRRIRDALQEHIDSDAVVAATELREHSAALLHALVLATAREAASLSYEITHGRRLDSREKERARTRRTEALATIARLVIERRKAQAESPDVPADVRAKVVAAFVEEVGRVAAEVLGGEVAERLMAAFKTRAYTA
jgi:hypothetical protein